jgi:hypothetical protein
MRETWSWLSCHFPAGWRRSSSAKLRLSEAYQRVFTGGADANDAQIVLTDLANETGFYRVNDYGVSADDRAFSDGKRAAFARIFQFLRMSNEERRSLEEAARHEAVVSSQEGQF